MLYGRDNVHHRIKPTRRAFFHESHLEDPSRQSMCRQPHTFGSTVSLTQASSARIFWSEEWVNYAGSQRFFRESHGGSSDTAWRLPNVIPAAPARGWVRTSTNAKASLLSRGPSCPCSVCSLPYGETSPQKGANDCCVHYHNECDRKNSKFCHSAKCAFQYSKPRRKNTSAARSAQGCNVNHIASANALIVTLSHAAFAELLIRP